MSDEPDAPADLRPGPLTREHPLGIERLGRREDQGVGESQGWVTRSQPGCLPGYFPPRRLDPDGEVVHEPLDPPGRACIPPIRSYQGFGVCARGEHQLVTAMGRDPGRCPRVERVVRVEEGDDDAGVEDD